MNNLQKGCLALLLLCSLFLNVRNNGFPLGYHPDEVKKVAFIENGSQDFYHPVLLLQSVRSLNAVFDFTVPQEIAELGRFVSALAGAAVVGATFLLAKRQMPPPWAFLASAMTATSPLIVMHAHYLKEDLLFTCFFLFTLLQLLRTLDAPKMRNFACLGLAAGLSISSKYAGFLLLPLSLFILLAFSPSLKRTLIKGLLLSAFIATGTFLAINYPIFADPSLFFNGISYELSHVAKGHDYVVPLPIMPLDFWFGFHFLFSLIPGIGVMTAILGAIFTFATLLFWKQASRDNKVISLFVLTVYLAAELSPLKPFPDFMRYMIPIAPLLILFSCEACRYLFGGNKILFPIGVLCLLLAAAAYQASNTLALINGLSRDTRDLASLWMMEHEGEYLAERYTSNTQSGRNRTLADIDIQKARNDGIKYLVLSSFVYDRVLFAATLDRRDPAIEAIHWDYARLFTLPFIEIVPKTPSYAFSNPTIRIIDITP